MIDVVDALSRITSFSKYSKHLDHAFRRETWEELCDRNMAMHIKKYPHLADDIKQLYKDWVVPKKVLPSMRSFQFAGRPIELANNRIYNCAALPIEHPMAFPEIMFMLLGGSGIGYSVIPEYISKLPKVQGTHEERKFIVGDSIEGWGDAIKVLVEAYFYGKARPRFVFDDIRPKGAKLITSGGKAPGPEPLKRCVFKVQEILNAAVGRRLRSIELHDMCCHIADAVLSGGIRRAALICLFDKTDTDMLHAKGNWTVNRYMIGATSPEGYTEVNVYDVQQPFYEPFTGKVYLSKEDVVQLQFENTIAWYNIHPQRGRANNSVILERDEVTEVEFFKLWKAIQNSGAGEPGVYWTNNRLWLTNPCCEIALRPYQCCNLTEINAGEVTTQEQFNAAAKAGALLGTLQAGYTDFHYLNPEWRKTTEEDTLLGVGVTGIGGGTLDKLNKKEAALTAVTENIRVAKLIGINPAARVTTVKPAGTSSLVLGCSSGIHAWHDEYYIRRVRYDKNEAIAKYLAETIPALVEDDLYSPTGVVCSFPQKAPDGAHMRSESPLTLLVRVKEWNEDWVRTGHIRGDNTNNVSCTISLKDDEWATVGDWMWENRDYYNGISVLPYNGGSYVQTPFESCTKEKYEELLNHFRKIDLTQVIEMDDNTNLMGEVACASGACEIG